MNGLPREIEEAPSLVPRGRTMIDAHPERDDIIRLLAEYALTPADRRISMQHLLVMIEEDFGLKMSDTALKFFMERKVVPAVHVTPEWIKRGVITGEFNLNTVEMKLKLAQKAYDDALKTETVEEVTKDGQVVERALTPMERSTLIKNAAGLIDSSESSMERFGVIPGKKVTVEKKEIKADLRGAMSRMQGRPGASPVIDAEVTRTTIETQG